jgi:hypothetical protein
MLSAEGEGHTVSVESCWRSHSCAGRVGYMLHATLAVKKGKISKKQAQSHACPLADDWCCLMRGVGRLAPWA